MNFPLHIDASMLREWSDCREFVRQRYLESRDAAAPSIYYVFGTAIHKGVEEFWKGNSFEKALYSSFAICNAYPTKMLNPYFTQKWKEMTDQLTDLLAVYYDYHDNKANPEELLQVELEWSIPYSDEATLCGRIDRVMAGPELTDIKTASEIASYGQTWKDAYTRSSMLQTQFGLYDWYLQKIGLAPRRVYLEVLLKGYKSKPCRLEIIELTHVTTEAYRKRFEQQLAFKVHEIVHYFKNYRDQKPWPMSGGSACSTKYGECSFLEICLNGTIPKVMEKFKEREEHLLVRGAK